ncbi:MAG: 16S rRNA (uracil(1498)-N(3))-methyltransferase [Proteobacteria bacterium]|nr:16S rRNA (uracil(1498)-N(3))-methyltransferase [Pseudomonadota bacterium]
MNIILAEAAEVVDSQLTLSDYRAEHIVKVLKSEIGDRLRVGIINGMRGFGTISALQKKFPFSASVNLELSESPGTLPPLDLILALPRPIMLKRILSQVTALGVGTIHLVNANRVEKSFWEAGLLQPQEYRPHLLHGLEQAVDTRMPEIRLHPKFKPFIEDFCPSLVGDYHYLLLADPKGEHRLVDVVGEKTGRILLAAGPEGGWVPYEVQKFREQGFFCCTIGERILKVDTAIIALHASITALRQRR